MKLKKILLTGLAALTLASCGKSNLEQMAEIAQKVPELQLVKDNFGKDALSGELTPKNGKCISKRWVNDCVDDYNGNSDCTVGISYLCDFNFSEGVNLWYYNIKSEDYRTGNSLPDFNEKLTSEKLFEEALAKKNKVKMSLYGCKLPEPEEVKEHFFLRLYSPEKTSIRCDFVFFNPQIIGTYFQRDVK